MLRSNIANHNSRELIVPRHANLQDGRRSVSFLTKELKIDMVTEASYVTLTKMKEQVERGYRDGYTDTDRDQYFDKPTKRTIEDTLARIYDQQNAALYYQGRSLPPRVPFDWVDLSDDKFFEKVPQLMRLEQSIQEDPITDCLALIPKLTYTYLEGNNTGEARFHEDALLIFRNTLVWVSETEDETQAIWFTRPDEGLRNIIKELNVVISRGRGPQRIVTKISITLKYLKNNHKSHSMSDFLKRFKTTAHETRVEALKLRFTNEEVYRILRSTPLPNPVRQPEYQSTIK
jgi:hypothetical protein